MLADRSPAVVMATRIEDSLVYTGAGNKLDTLLAPSFPPFLLLLSDSALPLGSFAFSSGLESYLAHHTVSSAQSPPILPFLTLSIASIASTTLPYVVAAYKGPERLQILDNDIDASTPCTVARRASIAQGKALLGVWDRAFKPHAPLIPGSASASGSAELAEARIPSPSSRKIAAERALSVFAQALREPALHALHPSLPETQPNGHLAPLWGVVCARLGLSLRDTLWVFLFNHAKAVLSAAVRKGVMGPYQAQGVLASKWLGESVADGLSTAVEKGLDPEGRTREERDTDGRGSQGNWNSVVEEAGQSVPVMDLWVGRHEVLYSRIFNS